MMRLARWACLVTFPRCFPDTVDPRGPKGR